MQCPIDQTTLAMTERQGIEIDYCPKCRGVWLDRGELDKLIAVNSDDSQSARHEQPRTQFREQRVPDRSYEYDKKRKKKSLLSDLFDF